MRWQPWHRAAAGLVCFACACAARAADDIRDLRGPKGAAAGWPLPALAAAVALALLAGYVAWRWLRRPRSAPLIAPAEAALAALETARAMLSPAQAREFCDAVSDVIRHYIESQFAIDAQRRTTEEFLQEIAALPASPLSAYRKLLGSFLQRCDFVRFSGASAEVSNLEGLYQAARSFVTETASSRHDALPAA